jgi:hypothetical protein
MARTSVKATYALDVASVRALEKMAQRWEVSKSEALRRAIHAAAAAQPPCGQQGIDVLDRVQRTLALSPAKAGAWVREVQTERRARSSASTKLRGR